VACEGSIDKFSFLLRKFFFVAVNGLQFKGYTPVTGISPRFSGVGGSRVCTSVAFEKTGFFSDLIVTRMCNLFHCLWKMRKNAYVKTFDDLVVFLRRLLLPGLRRLGPLPNSGEAGLEVLLLGVEEVVEVG